MKKKKRTKKSNPLARVERQEITPAPSGMDMAMEFMGGMKKMRKTFNVLTTEIIKLRRQNERHEQQRKRSEHVETVDGDFEIETDNTDTRKSVGDSDGLWPQEGE